VLENNICASAVGGLTSSTDDTRAETVTEGRVKDKLKSALETLVGLPKEIQRCEECLLARGMLMANLAELEARSGNEQTSRELHDGARAYFTQVSSEHLLPSNWEERAAKAHQGNLETRVWNPRTRFLDVIAAGHDYRDP
jgi:hypothetical protein